MRPVDLREDENMAEEKMIIEIGEDGAISVDLNGFKGQGCAAIMDLMEKALGPARRNNKRNTTREPAHGRQRPTG